MENLKPCPFCGCEAYIIEGDYSSWEEGYAVRCSNCALTFGASGRLGETYKWTCCYNNKADVIEAWNIRYERTCYNIDTINKEWFFCCSECHSVNDDNFYNEWSYCPDCGAKVVN